MLHRSQTGLQSGLVRVLAEVVAILSSDEEDPGSGADTSFPALPTSSSDSLVATPKLPRKFRMESKVTSYSSFLSFRPPRCMPCRFKTTFWLARAKLPNKQVTAAFHFAHVREVFLKTCHCHVAFVVLLLRENLTVKRHSLLCAFCCV